LTGDLPLTEFNMRTIFPNFPCIVVLYVAEGHRLNATIVI